MNFADFLATIPAKPKPVVEPLWQQRIRGLLGVPVPKEPRFGLGKTPSKTVPVVVATEKGKRTIQAWPTGVHGLVVHPTLTESSRTLHEQHDPSLTVTHTPSGMMFATDIRDIDVEDAIRSVQDLAVMWPSIDFSLPTDALVKQIQSLGAIKTIPSDFADLINQQATYPSVGRRKQALREYQKVREDYYKGKHVTASDIVRAFDTEGRVPQHRGMVSAPVSDFVDVYGFRYWFGWDVLSDQLVPHLGYSHQQQGEHFGKRVLWNEDIEAAFVRFLQRVTEDRHARARKAGLPLLYQIPRIYDAPMTLSADQIKAVKNATVRADDARTRSSGGAPFVLDGQSWVAQGYSWGGDSILKTDLHEVVPVDAWPGRPLTLKTAESAANIGVSGVRPFPGQEVFLKGKRYVYTGRVKPVEGPDSIMRSGSSSRRGPSFPFFYGQV